MNKFLEPQQKPAKSLFDYLLHLGDTNLILAQRLAAWCGHGPILEQDIAMTNIALDLLGQGQYYYELASILDQKQRNADQLAMTRSEQEYKNLLLVELPNGNFADTIMRQFLYDSYHLMLLEKLEKCTYAPLREIAEKAIKEVRYHVQWSTDWIKRLGDGTEESHQKLQRSFETYWPYALESFAPADYEQALDSAGILSLPWQEMQSAYLKKVEDILAEATLYQACAHIQGINKAPETNFFHQGGKHGRHTEHMGYLLTELQFMQKTYPGMEW